MPGLMKRAGPVMAMILALVTSGCATTGGPANVDPWEPFNRKMFAFNEDVDKKVLKPVATGYKKVVPAAVRKGVGNVFLNLAEPTTIVNDVLQAKFPQAGRDLVRFALNTTVGLLGWFDVARKVGLERNHEDFGQTFSVWGFGQGPYLVLPLLGPSTVADGVGLVPATLYTDPRYTMFDTAESFAIIGFNAVDTRARLLGASRVAKLQLDPYVFRRETYLQRRQQLVHDGNPPGEDDFMDEDWEDEIWEEDEDLE